MTKKEWEVLQINYCQRVADTVHLEVEVAYPLEVLPETAPRVLAHRCSRGADCNLDDKPACMWAGTNPVVDPFAVA